LPKGLAQQLPTARESAGRDRKLAHTGWPLEKNEFRLPLGDSSRTGKMTHIALKNLQNPRICHVPM
jgi:hypothetical protein